MNYQCGMDEIVGVDDYAAKAKADYEAWKAKQSKFEPVKSTGTISSAPTGPREIPVEKAQYVSITKTAEQIAYEKALAQQAVAQQQQVAAGQAPSLRAVYDKVFPGIAPWKVAAGALGTVLAAALTWKLVVR